VLKQILEAPERKAALQRHGSVQTLAGKFLIQELYGIGNLHKPYAYFALVDWVEELLSREPELVGSSKATMKEVAKARGKAAGA
jgi:hypothetical protein